jgi:hypothetical protein
MVSAASAIGPTDADRVVSAADWHDEIEMIGPDRVRVSAVDRLGGITPEMVGWWFGRMDQETYFRFHPIDHAKFAWVRGKQPGRYVGATHLTYHCYGGPPSPVLRSEISFVPPEELLDPGLFAAFDVGAAVCAVVHALDEQDRPQPQESGRFLHIARRAGYGTELRSCWWLTVPEGVDFDLITKGRLRHVHEEFAYLTGFLPALYAEGAQA